MSLVLHPVLNAYHADDVQAAEVDGSFAGWHTTPLYIGTNEFIVGSFMAPGDIDGAGTVQFWAFVTPITAAATKNVGLRFSHAPLAAGESVNVSAAWIDEDSGDVAMDPTQDDLSIANWSETVANLGWIANDWIPFRLSRIAAAANELSGGLLVLDFFVEVPQA